MKFHGKAEQAAASILSAFQSPQSLPAALAPVFIRRKDGAPCRAWSWANQFLVATHGHSDARGFRQWQDVGRCVRKGERSFAILVPLSRKIERENASTGETESVQAVYGFTSAAVFGLAQTEGDDLPPPDPAVSRWIEDLPLLDVARSWGLSVDAYNGREGAALGRFSSANASIAVGVENLSTWCHEMIHAADHRLGALTSFDAKWRAETVAELGGAVLLTCLGRSHDADLGGCWEYVRGWCTHDGLEPVAACQRMLKRTCDAVALILDAAEQLAAGTVPTAEPAAAVV